jgi:uncharacterized protein DUF3592
MVVQEFGGGFGLLWVSFWSLITLAFDAAIFWGAARQLAALGYPSVEARITHSEVHVQAGQKGKTYHAELRYVYTVEGVDYTGETYRYGAMASSDGNAARIVEAHPVGMVVPVYYNPSVPGDAVLKTGIEGMDLFLAMFLTPFNLIMLAGWWSVWHSWSQAQDDTPFAGFSVRREEDRLHVRLRDPSLAAAGGAAGATSFVLIFVLGFSTGFNPPLGVMVSAWGLIATASLVAYRLNHWKEGSAPRELVLDTLDDRLHLFRQSRVVPAHVIAAAAITHVTVRNSGSRHSQGSGQYETTLHFRDEQGGKACELLGSWPVETKANALANGLRAWLKRSGHAVQ